MGGGTECPCLGSVEGVHGDGDCVAHLELRNGGNGDGTIVGTGITQGIVALNMVDGETVMGMLTTLGSHHILRVHGIAPAVAATLRLGCKLHIDVRTGTPHTFYARRVATDNSGAVGQDAGTCEGINLRRKRRGRCGRLGDIAHHGTVDGVGTVGLDVGVGDGVLRTVVEDETVETAGVVGMHVGHLREEVGIGFALLGTRAKEKDCNQGKHGRPAEPPCSGAGRERADGHNFTVCILLTTGLAYIVRILWRRKASSGLGMVTLAS